MQLYSPGHFLVIIFQLSSRLCTLQPSITFSAHFEIKCRHFFRRCFCCLTFQLHDFFAMVLLLACSGCFSDARKVLFARVNIARREMWRRRRGRKRENASGTTCISLSCVLESREKSIVLWVALGGRPRKSKLATSLRSSLAHLVDPGWAPIASYVSSYATTPTTSYLLCPFFGPHLRVILGAILGRMCKRFAKRFVIAKHANTIRKLRFLTTLTSYTIVCWAQNDFQTNQKSLSQKRLSKIQSFQVQIQPPDPQTGGDLLPSKASYLALA